MISHIIAFAGRLDDFVQEVYKCFSSQQTHIWYDQILGNESGKFDATNGSFTSKFLAHD